MRWQWSDTLPAAQDDTAEAAAATAVAPAPARSKKSNAQKSSTSAQQTTPEESTAAAPDPRWMKGSRQNATTQAVCEVLTDYCERIPLVEIAHRRSVLKGSVENWTSKARWRSTNFVRTLSARPDYPQYREQLGDLLRRLEFWTDPLPEPAARRSASFDAHALKIALTYLVEHPDPPRRGQNKPDIIAGMVGVKKATVESWLTTAGRLKRPPGAVMRMEGYLELRGQLQALFKRLGHADIAGNLRESGENTLQAMAATRLVEALTVLGKNPKTPLSVVAQELNVGRALVAEYLSPNGSLRDTGRVEELADFAAHRDALIDALRVLGHHEQASSLGFQKVDASRLLHALREIFDHIANAVRALRADRALTVRDAAMRVGLPVALLAVLVEEGGYLREPDAVHALLTSFKPYLQRGIDEQLDQLAQVCGGESSVVSAGTSGMKAVTFAARGTIAARVFVVRSSSGDPGVGSNKRLNGIYANNPDLVQEPRSYQHERSRQALRWLATVLREQFPKAIEVQCYFREKGGEILLSSNSDRVNLQLKAFLADGGLTAMLDGAASGDAGRSERLARHRTKLHGRLAPRSAGGEPSAGTPEAADSVFDAMRHARFVVLTNRYRDNDRFVEMHAERRIKYALQRLYDEALDPACLAGTMRPCGVCADDLGLAPGTRRGPFWLSGASQAFVANTERIIEANVRDSIGTHVTRPRGQRGVTIEHDTDSDSDADQNQ